MANLANNSIKKILAGVIATAFVIMPGFALAARTSIDWVNLSGTTYIQPNYPSGVDLLIYGSNRYINFNTITGSSGYGFRDNSGTLQFKNSGGSWTAFGSGGGSSGGLSTTTPWNAGELAQVVDNGTVKSIATSSLGLLTTDVAEGSNLYYTGARSLADFITNLSATTSVKSITTLPSLSLPYSQLTGTPSIPGYPFALTGNATSTLTQFNGGLTAYASSTVGAGGQATGLTISGGATTTGNAYFASKIGVASTSPSTQFDVTGNALISGTVSAGNFIDTSFSGNNCIGESSGLLGQSTNCVSSIASAGGTLTISSPTGNVDTSLNLSHQNTWSALQIFPNASSTLFSNFNKAYFGGTATTTIDSAGNIVIPSGSSLTNTGVTNGCATWASGILGTTGTACGSGGGGSQTPWTSAIDGAGYALTNAGAITGTSITATSTSVASSFQQASSTQFSVFNKAYFGGTATSSFNSTGNLSLVAGAVATPATTFGTAGTGIYGNGSGVIDFSLNGTNGVTISSTAGVQLATGWYLAWSNTTADTAITNMDVILKRYTTNTLGLTDSNGSFFPESLYGGNLSIASSTPSERLTVNGSTLLSGSITAQGPNFSFGGFANLSDWQTSLTNTLNQSEGFGGFNIRIVASSTLFSIAGAGASRVTFAAPAGNSMWINAAYIGTGGTEGSFSGTPVRLTYHGQTQFNIPANSTIVTDPAPYQIPGSGDVLISYSTYGSGSMPEKAPTTGWGTFYKSQSGDNSDAGTVSMSGYTNYSTTHSAVGINKVEVATAISSNVPLLSNTNNNVGISTSSAIAKFGLQLWNGETNPYAFLIASSTSNSTSTLFSISNSGVAAIPKLGTAAGTFLAADPNGNIIATTTPSGGSGTVTSVNAGSTGSSLTFTNGPVTTSGTINGEINLSHSNVWSVLQSFSLASSTMFSNFGTAYFGGTATTTIDSAGNVAVAGTLNVTGKTTVGAATTTDVTVSNSLQIPNSSNPSPTITGYITQSTNAPYQIHAGGSGATTVFDPRPAFILTVSSTTPLTGTTTAPVWTLPMGMTVTNWFCTVQPGGATAEVEWQYANPSSYVTVAQTYMAAVTTPSNTTISSNNTPAALATSTLMVGNVTGSPTSVSCSFYGNSAAI